MKHKIILAILALLIAFSAHSAPARKGTVIFSQPDGTLFQGRIRGDEFMKIVTTAEGCAITQDDEGWWCYAYYDAAGKKAGSGYRVGGDVPSDVIGMSKNIPHSILAVKAKAKRATVPNENEPLLKRVMKHHGAETKSGASATVTKHGLIILAEFKDVKFKHTRNQFISLLTKPEYSLNGATGSAKEYFDDQFGGKFEFVFDVSPIVTLPNNVAYYGENDDDESDIRPGEMIYDACMRVKDDVDFSIYDDDDDGYVDNVFVFFAGGDEAEGAGDDRIWSHSWDLVSAGKPLTLNGVRIGTYACTSELSRRYNSTMTRYNDVLTGIGVFCHEYFHTFGIPDLYDTDYEGSGGQSMALWGSTALMDSGNQNNDGNTPPYLNAIERDFLGLTDPVTINTNGSYILEPIHLNGQYYRINTDNKDEYYILECRSNDKWDEYIGGKGMLLYHIDKSDNQAGESEFFGIEMTAAQRWSAQYNEVNCYPYHQCADLVEADGRADAVPEYSDMFNSTNIKNIFFPTSNVTAIYPNGNPALEFWSGEAAKTSVTNIRMEGNNIRFNIAGLFSVTYEVFSDAAIIQIDSEDGQERDTIIEWGLIGKGASGSLRAEPYLPGKYSATLEGLQPNNKTYWVKIYFEVEGIAEEVKNISFMTKKSPAVDWPYMAIGNSGRLPLRLYNAAEAAEVNWYFNGAAVSRGADGYFTPTQEGRLKAEIIWKNGSEEIIVKEIVLGEDEK